MSLCHPVAARMPYVASHFLHVSFCCHIYLAYFKALRGVSDMPHVAVISYRALGGVYDRPLLAVIHMF